MNNAKQFTNFLSNALFQNINGTNRQLLYKKTRREMKIFRFRLMPKWRVEKKVKIPLLRQSKAIKGYLH